jgi:hypothetical protein
MGDSQRDDRGRESRDGPNDRRAPDDQRADDRRPGERDGGRKTRGTGVSLLVKNIPLDAR